MGDGDENVPAEPSPAEAVARDVVERDTKKRNGGRPGKQTGIGIGGRTIPRGVMVGAAIGLAAVAAVGIYSATGGSSGAKSTPAVQSGAPSAGSSSSSSSLQQAFAPNTVFDGCIVIDPQGNTTVLRVAFTLVNPEPGNYTATFGQSPSGPLSGTGTATNGANPITVPLTATAFGDYGQLAIKTPGGNPVQSGPLAQLLPLTLNAATDKPNDCKPDALKTPSAAGPSSGIADVQAITDFLNRLAHDNATGNADDAVAILNPAVLQRYGADQCRSFLAAQTDATAAFTVHNVRGPMSYDYTSDGLTTTVPNVFFVDATRIQNGQPNDQTVHVARDSNGALSWFTDCGTPLANAN